MAGGVLAFADAVAAVRIRHHRERLVVRDQFVDQRLGALIMDVVIAGPVDELLRETGMRRLEPAIAALLRGLRLEPSGKHQHQAGAVA